MFDKTSWRDKLANAIGVISCLGAFGSNDFMQKVEAAHSWQSLLKHSEACMCVLVCRTLPADTSAHTCVQICGDSNILVFDEAADAGVPRAAFISVHDYKFPSAPLQPFHPPPAACMLPIAHNCIAGTPGSPRVLAAGCS